MSIEKTLLETIHGKRAALKEADEKPPEEDEGDEDMPKKARKGVLKVDPDKAKEANEAARKRGKVAAREGWKAASACFKRFTESKEIDVNDLAKIHAGLVDISYNLHVEAKKGEFQGMLENYVNTVAPLFDSFNILLAKAFGQMTEDVDVDVSGILEDLEEGFEAILADDGVNEETYSNLSSMHEQDDEDEDDDMDDEDEDDKKKKDKKEAKDDEDESEDPDDKDIDKGEIKKGDKKDLVKKLKQGDTNKPGEED